MKVLKSFIEHKGLLKYLKNTSWVFLEKVLRIFVGIFVGVWVARYLGPEQFGILNYAIALVGIFTAFAALGLDSIVVRELVKDGAKKYEILGTSFLLKIIGAILTLLFIYILTIFLPNDSLTNSLLLIIASSTIFHSFHVIDFYFQSKVLSRYVVYANVASLLLSSIVKIILILNDSPLIAFAWAILFDSFILGIGLLYNYFSLNQIRNFHYYKFSMETAKSLLNDSWPLILSSVFIIIYMKIDQVMINVFLGSEAVGIYSAATRLSEAIYFIPIVVSASLFPAVVNAKKSNNKIIYYSRLQNLYDFMVWIAILIALPVMFFSTSIVNVLYGQQYAQSSTILIIHIWTSVFVFLGVASGKWFVSENFMKLYLLRSLYGVLCNVVLNFMMIPTYGIEGAAIATLFGYGVVGYFSDLFNIKTRRNFIMKTKALMVWRLFKTLKVLE